METALVRGVPDSFANALRADSGPALDPYLARKQHGEYVAALASAGYVIEELATDESHPDCVFVEDAAVVIGSVAVIARSGAASRREEVGPVREALSSRFSCAAIQAPGTLDGGDVMHIGGQLYPCLEIRRCIRSWEDSCFNVGCSTPQVIPSRPL